MDKKVISIAAAGLMLLPTLTMADTGIGAKIGTLGAGVELTKNLYTNINGRIGLNAGSKCESGTESGINYSIDFDVKSATLFFDWHPFSGGLRFSTGVAINDNELTLVGVSATSYTIGTTTYTAAQVGTLNGSVTFDNINPYLGVGWGNAVDPDDRFTFSADLGVLYQGTPEAKLTATGLIASNAAFQADLAAEQAELNQSLDDFELYPVISVGLAYRF